MPRALILIDDPRTRLDGATTIEPGYPRDYTPDEMRMWAEDLERYYRTPAADLARWRSLPPDALAPDQERAVAVHDKYFVEPDRGIKGSLRENGIVELDGGRHRAGYLLERGTTPIPVWVSARDQRALDELRRNATERTAMSERGPEMRETSSYEEPPRRKPDYPRIGQTAVRGVKQEKLAPEIGKTAVRGANRERPPEERDR